jgi:predicted nucleotidyltransferase
MDEFSALTDAERTLFEALNRRGVRYMLVGLSAAVLQGANTGTRDIDIWFEDTSDPRIGEAVSEANGIWVSGAFGMRPPQIGGDAIGDRVDVVAHMHGLGKFEEELANTLEVNVDGIPLRVLKLERIIASKRASGRKKDVAVIPSLEEALAAVESAAANNGADAKR